MRKSLQWILGGVAGAAAGLALIRCPDLQGQQDAASPARAIPTWEEDPLNPSNPAFAALRKSVAVDFNELPLRLAIEEIRKQIDGNLVVDDQGIKNAMVDLGTERITLKLKGVPASRVFDLILTPHGLACAPQNGVLVVTDRESVKRKNFTRFYPVADLAFRPLGDDVESMGEKLAAVIPNICDYDVWAVHGGDCTVEYYSPTPALLINCQLETHERLEGVFEALRTLKRRMPTLLREAGFADAEDFHRRRRVVLNPSGEVQLEKEAEAVDADKSTADLAKEAKTVADTALMLALRLESTSTGKTQPSTSDRKEQR